MSYTWYTKGSGLDFDRHENYVNYTDKIHSQTGVAFNCGVPNVTKNIDNLTDFYIGFTVYYTKDNPGPNEGAWNWLNVTGNGTVFINGSDNYLCCMPDNNGYKPPYKKGLSHIIVHVDTVNDKIEYWYNLQKVYTRESAGIAGKSYTAINMCPTGGGAAYAERDNAISDLIITTEKTELDKYISKFFQPVSITFDGSTNYAEIPVSLTDVSDWSAEITFETTENRSESNIYHQHCLFGYDTPGFLSRDFHVDTKDGKLYIFGGLGGKTPIGGTPTNDGGDYGINTGVTVNDGKRHTVKAVSTTGKLEVYCDNVLTTTIYPTKTLNADAFYIGCSKIGESVFGRLTLYSFKLKKNGKTVAEYEPTVRDAALKTLTDKSGNGNDATLYGNVYEYKAVDIYFDLSSDTSRTVQATTAVKADTCRTIAAHLADFDISADTARTVHRAEIVGADTGRTVQTVTTINADAARKTVLPFEINADTQRSFGVSIPFSFGADTSCIVERTEKINADFSRRVEKTIAVNVDAMRDVQAPFSIAVDTARNLQNNISLSVDTSRTVERIECVNGDSIRYLVFDMDKLLIPANQPPAQGEFTPFPANPPKAAKQGVISMTLELATGTLSDTLNFETFGTDFTPKRAIRGTFLDFPYEYRVEQVANIGGRQKVTSMSYIDRLLYVPLKFHVEGGKGDKGDNLKNIAKALAKHLGYACETHIENIYLATDYNDTTVTYSAVMSGAFGWLSELPWRQVNVYIKGGKMCFVQRGQEPNVYDITDLHHDEPTIVQKVFRSRFSANNKNAKPAQSVHTRGFSGAVEYPDGGWTNYDNGLPTYSYRYSGKAIVQTWWHYQYGTRRLESQETYTEPNGADINRSETHTEFHYYGGHSYTVTETRTTTIETDRMTGKTTKTETVNYTENTNGSTTSTTMRDGDVVVSNGPASVNTGSEFSINQQNIIMTGGKTKWLDDDGKEIKDEADISFSSLPLSTKANKGVRLSEFAAEINSHDRCVEETVEMNILEAVKDGVPSLTHVINFGERIKYNGNEYCLERNTVTRTTREIKQNIVMIRWFDLSEGVKG